MLTTFYNSEAVLRLRGAGRFGHPVTCRLGLFLLLVISVLLAVYTFCMCCWTLFFSLSILSLVIADDTEFNER
jgi:uncharacterized membrane protein